MMNQEEKSKVNTVIDNTERFSISKKLRKENRSNDLFEIMLNNVNIEELIALKLELVNKTVGSNIYGIPLWRSLDFIIKDALLKYALAVNSSKRKAGMFLGIQNKDIFGLINYYGLREYHNEIWGKDPNSVKLKNKNKGE